MFDFTAFAQDVRVILLELSERLRGGLETGRETDMRRKRW
jgi:hypothetical protein